MKKEDLFKEFLTAFQSRKFVAGLLVSLIDFLMTLGLPRKNIRNFSDLLKSFPREEYIKGGKKANTLVVRVDNEKTLSLRPFYNQVENYIRNEKKRFDYPSCAPHATQAWPDYVNWLDMLCTFSSQDLLSLRESVVNHVLDYYVDQSFQPGDLRLERPLFRLLLNEFDVIAHKGEPTGAAYQGIVFGFLRADNPHLQIEIDKVRTGSKRLQRIGDIDGWEGKRLALSAEVKQFVVETKNVRDFAAFAGETNRRNALGIVAALGFDSVARDSLEELGLKTLDRQDISQIVELWDTLKQRTAIASFEYYVQHVEKNSSLSMRLQDFLDLHREK